MKRITLGKSGISASAVALGCMRMNALSHQELDRYIHTAVELGINLFDHADIYGGGECEALFGKTLAAAPTLRDKMIVQSKCGIREKQYDFSYAHIMHSVEGSLKRLNIDCLDLLLLHRPDALMEPEEVAKAFERLEREGKVKHFGVSNFHSMQCALLQQALKQTLVVNQLQFSIMFTGMIDAALCANTKFDGSLDHDAAVLDYCRMNGITIQAWSPYQYGFFEGTFIDNPLFPELNACMDALAEKYCTSKTALATAWILRHPAKMQVISGTTNAKRLEEICAGSAVEMSREDWYAIYLAAGNQLP